jgi:two-component sensor histidine kinase
MLEYRDDGPGYPHTVLEGQYSGVGLHLLSSIAERTLRARVELFNDGGAVTRIHLPPAVEQLGEDRAGRKQEPAE